VDHRHRQEQYRDERQSVMKEKQRQPIR
jgi:hypothetical protein